jgi:PAS domain S-box-containing protein
MSKHTPPIQATPLERVNTALAFLFSDAPQEEVLQQVLEQLGTALHADGAYLSRCIALSGPSIQLQHIAGIQSDKGQWAATPTFTKNYNLSESSLALMQQYATDPSPVMQRREDLLPDSPELAYLEKNNFAAIIDFPLFIGQQMWGFLTVSYTDNPKDTIEDILPLFKGFTYALGHYLQRKEMEEEQRKQRDFFLRLLNLTPTMITVKDVEGRYKFMNAAAAKGFEKEPSEIIGKTALELHPYREEGLRLTETHEEMLKAKKPFRYQRYILKVDGTPRLLDVNKTPILDQNGEVEEVINIITDITDWRAIEEKMQKERERNASLMELIPDQVFLIDFRQKEILHSNSTHDFLGYNLEEDEITYSFFSNRIHPEDRAIAIDDFYQRLQALGDGDVIDLEYRMQHKNGEWRWFYERAKIVSRTADGGLETYMTVLQDNTERKEIGEKIRSSEERYRNFIKYSNDGIYYMNCGAPIPTHLSPEEQTELYYQSAYIEECNEMLCQMYGYDKIEDLRGLSIEEAHQGDNYAENRRSFSIFAKQNYRIQDAVTKEIDREGNAKYFLNQAVGIIQEGALVGIWGTQQDITAKKQAELALKESEERFEMVVEGIKLGTWDWDITTGHVIFNAYWASMLGFTLEEVEPSVSFFTNRIHPDDFEPFNDAMQEHIQKKTPYFSSEFRLKTKSGSWKWVYDRGRITHWDENGIPKRAVGMHLDITDRKRAELNLIDSEALLKAILNALPDLKFRISKTGVILDFYSSGFDQDLLIPPSRFIGKSLDEVIPPHIAAATKHNLKEAIKSSKVTTFEYFLPINDAIQYFEARISAINQEQAMIVVRNISELKKMQIDLNEKLKELDQKNNKLKEYIDSNMQLEHFAYIASHDLREPVRTMRTFAQLLQHRYSEDIDETGQSYINFVVDGANQMNQLIQDLLKYSRVNTVKEEIITVDTQAVVEQVLTELQEFIQEKQAVIHVEGTLPDIRAGKQRIRQVFLNLISNAIKFHKLESPPEVTIRGLTTNTHHTFTISDNGIGIDPEFFDKIFLLFKKLHSRKDFQGTGLGLAICKKIIEQYDGEIWVESEPDKGARFVFTLPK